MEELNLNSRRSFLKKSAFAGAGFFAFNSIPNDVLAKSELVKITILHTNDVHSHIDPFPENDPKYPGLGGAVNRAALIKKIRMEEKNVLLLDCGDIFQGTPYFNMYGGELEFKLMSMMQYDASTIGNHDFDNGLDGLVKQLPHAAFPFINNNYDFSDTPMAGKTIPHKIFMKDGIKIGVFGIGIELAGLVDKRMYGNTIYLDPVKKAAEAAHHLKQEEKCDLVICLSHLGYTSKGKQINDVELAKKSKYIDVILGAHTHTFLDKPSEYQNSDGKKILVAQVGWAGLRLGRIDYIFERKTKKMAAEGHSIKISKKSIAI
ncbi:MAG: twin-arginine translocation signal protein [Bacteroidota bacterium]|jgi:5'-nucleotidase|nr:twin-arginine translocation signal protein [Bacteroidota bacterium]